MALSVICGRAKSGKSEYILKKAFECEGLLIVPKMSTLELEQKLTDMVGAIGLSGVEVLSFGRLSARYKDLGPLADSSLDSSAKIMAISAITDKVQDELTTLKGSSKRSGFAETMVSAIKEFKRFSVTPADIKSASEKAENKVLSSKLSDIALIYVKYAEFIDSGY